MRIRHFTKFQFFQVIYFLNYKSILVLNDKLFYNSKLFLRCKLFIFIFALLDKSSIADLFLTVFERNFIELKKL